MPKVQQFRKQTVQQKSAVPKSQLPKPPEMPTVPGKQDRICNAVHIGGLSLGAIVLLGSAYGISQAALKAIHQTPVDVVDSRCRSCRSRHCLGVFRRSRYAGDASESLARSRSNCAESFEIETLFPGWNFLGGASPVGSDGQSPTVQRSHQFSHF